MTDQTPDVDVSFDGPVATVEIRRPPHNFFTIPLIQHLADAFEDLEADRRQPGATELLRRRGGGASGREGPRRSARVGARARCGLRDQPPRRLRRARRARVGVAGVAHAL